MVLCSGSSSLQWRQAWVLPSAAPMHACRHCKELVNPLGRHGLSYRWSEGRHYRHSALNDIVCRALSSAHVPAVLEPSGLSRSDGKRPDGVTIAPWSSGKSLVWDATCLDTFALSHRSLAVHSAGKIAAKAEDLKSAKYVDLLSSHNFVPVTIETTGVFGPYTLSFVKLKTLSTFWRPQVYIFISTPIHRCPERQRYLYSRHICFSQLGPYFSFVYFYYTLNCYIPSPKNKVKEYGDKIGMERVQGNNHVQHPQATPTYISLHVV